MFFSPDNLNLKKWYIIGYILGDGYINDKSVSICTTEKDKDNLYAMYQYMKLNTKIFTNKRRGSSKEYYITKRCEKWIEDLALYGIVPNKSKISYIPLDYLNTSEEEAAICRSLFDADGSINFIKNVSYTPKFYFCAGSKKLCEDYAFLLQKNCGIICKVNDYRDGILYEIQIYGIKKCKCIYNFLYGHENFYIKRKKERFEKLLNGTFTLKNDNY